jgi:hypothetical protein
MVGNFSKAALFVWAGLFCSLGFDLATRNCTRLRTYFKVSICFRDKDLGSPSSLSESDSQTDCSGYISDVEVEGLSLVEGTVGGRSTEGDGGPGLGTGLGHSLAGMNKA